MSLKNGMTTAAVECVCTSVCAPVFVLQVCLRVKKMTGNIVFKASLTQSKHESAAIACSHPTYTIELEQRAFVPI